VDDALRVVLCTAPDADAALRIARALVDERLVACVNVLPGVASVYRWQGRVQEDSEVLLVMKTQAQRLPALTERVAALHPYEVPEVLALAASEVAGPYAAWVRAETAR
jgi:periplasmic divalent cation tolerance protein